MIFALVLLVSCFVSVLCDEKEKERMQRPFVQISIQFCQPSQAHHVDRSCKMTDVVWCSVAFVLVR